MSSGVALSTPREHLNNIEMTIKATGLFAATARIRYGAAAQACRKLPSLQPRKASLRDAQASSCIERTQLAVNCLSSLASLHN